MARSTQEMLPHRHLAGVHLEAKAGGERTWDPAYPGLPQTAEPLVKFVTLPYDLGRESTLRSRVSLHSILGPTENLVEDVVSSLSSAC